MFLLFWNMNILFSLIEFRWREEIFQRKVCEVMKKKNITQFRTIQKKECPPDISSSFWNEFHSLLFKRVRLSLTPPGRGVSRCSHVDFGRTLWFCSTISVHSQQRTCNRLTLTAVMHFHCSLLSLFQPLFISNILLSWSNCCPGQMLITLSR